MPSCVCGAWFRPTSIKSPISYETTLCQSCIVASTPVGYLDSTSWVLEDLTDEVKSIQKKVKDNYSCSYC